MLWRSLLLLLFCVAIVAAQKGGTKGGRAFAASEESPIQRVLNLQRKAEESQDAIRQVQEPDRDPAEDTDIGTAIGGGRDGHAAPEPYQFSFAVDDPESGASTAREERQDINGEVVGFYLIKDQDGRSRRVEYTAGKDGFKATIKSNEEGIVARSPADVVVEVSASEGIARYENSKNSQRHLTSESAQSYKGSAQIPGGGKFFQRLIPTQQAPVQVHIDNQRYDSQNTADIVQQQQQHVQEEDYEPPVAPARPIIEQVKVEPINYPAPSIPVAPFQPIKSVPRPVITQEFERPIQQFHVEPVRPRPQYTPTQSVIFRERQPIRPIVQTPVVHAPVVDQQVHIQEEEPQPIDDVQVVQQRQPVQEHIQEHVQTYEPQPVVQKVEPLPVPISQRPIAQRQFTGSRTVVYREQNAPTFRHVQPSLPVRPIPTVHFEQQKQDQIQIQEEEPYDDIKQEVVQVTEPALVQQHQDVIDTVDEPIPVQVKEEHPVKSFPLRPLPPPIYEPPQQQVQVIEHTVKRPLPPPPPPRPIYEQRPLQVIERPVIKSPPPPPPRPVIIEQRPQPVIVEQVKLPPPPPPQQVIYEQRPQQVFEEQVKLPPPPPRPVIIEQRPQQVIHEPVRLPPPPPQPRPVFIEQRPQQVIHEPLRLPPPPPRPVIIQHRPQQVFEEQVKIPPPPPQPQRVIYEQRPQQVVEEQVKILPPPPPRKPIVFGQRSPQIVHEQVRRRPVFRPYYEQRPVQVIEKTVKGPPPRPRPLPTFEPQTLQQTVDVSVPLRPEKCDCVQQKYPIKTIASEGYKGVVPPPPQPTKGYQKELVPLPTKGALKVPQGPYQFNLRNDYEAPLEITNHQIIHHDDQYQDGDISSSLSLPDYGQSAQFGERNHEGLSADYSQKVESVAQ